LVWALAICAVLGTHVRVRSCRCGSLFSDDRDDGYPLTWTAYTGVDQSGGMGARGVPTVPIHADGARVLGTHQRPEWQRLPAVSTAGLAERPTSEQRPLPPCGLDLGSAVVRKHESRSRPRRRGRHRQITLPQRRRCRHPHCFRDRGQVDPRRRKKSGRDCCADAVRAAPAHGCVPALGQHTGRSSELAWARQSSPPTDPAVG